MTGTPKILAAKADAEQAQARFMATLHELQHRVAPGTLASNAWSGAKNKGADLAEDAVDAVRRRPLTATGVAAAVAVFLAREPLWDLASKLVGKGKDGRGKGDQSKDADENTERKTKEKLETAR